MSKFLVTGGAGFIGSHLVEALLKQGHEVIVLDDLSVGKAENVPASAKLVVGSICDIALVNQLFQDIDGCYHLAAIPSVVKANEAWLETHNVNLDGTIIIFDAARRARPDSPVPVVYASSSAVYGDTPNLPLTETCKPTPIGAYGTDKYGCELHARVAGIVHGVPTYGLRFFNVYGARQDPNSPYSGVISIFMKNLSENSAVTVYGDGHQTRDFIYVNDVVNFCLMAMKQTDITAPIANVCTGKETTILHLIEILAKVVNCKPDVVMKPPRIGDTYKSVGNPDYARQALGLEAQFDLASGLYKLYEFM